MQNLDDIIEFEPENTALDFKAIQYKKEKFYELLKDVIAMANADIDREGLIITGVDKQSNNAFTVVPIPNAEFVDSAIYQQLVTENVEPDLKIEYVPHLYKGTQLVGVLKIAQGGDKPYMMKKDYGSGKEGRSKGDSFIRKGTATFSLMRKDIDRIFEERKRENAFVHQVAFYFTGKKNQKIIEIQSLNEILLPSTKAANKIRAILAKREKARKEAEEKLQVEKERREQLAAKGIPSYNLDSLLKPVSYFGHFNSSKIIGLIPSSYEERDDKTLETNLENVSETYEEHDLHDFFEKLSEKINITVLNEGSKYLEDAILKIEIPETEGFLIADKLYGKPESQGSFLEPYVPRVASWETLHYSHYARQDGNYIYEQSLNDLRHLQPKEAFLVPIRVTTLAKAAGKEIEIALTLYGKNLPVPMKDKLIIKVL